MRIGLTLERVFPFLLFFCLPAWPSVAQGGQPPLFSEPLHLSREFSDPISGTITRLEEYCSNDRVISIRDSRTSIADYGAGELTEIDRAKGTYSVTKFDAIARALDAMPGSAAKRSAFARAPELTDAGVRPVGVRGGRAFEATIGNEGSSRKVEVVVDSQLKVTREALEVLVGAAFPRHRSEEHEIVIAAASRDSAGARSGSAPARDHALPLEQMVTWNVDGETIRVVNRIVRVGGELPDPDLIAIPPGARLVESELVLRSRLLDELDRLPSANPAPRP